MEPIVELAKINVKTATIDELYKKHLLYKGDLDKLSEKQLEDLLNKLSVDITISGTEDSKNLVLDFLNGISISSYSEDEYLFERRYEFTGAKNVSIGVEQEVGVLRDFCVENGLIFKYDDEIFQYDGTRGRYEAAKGIEIYNGSNYHPYDFMPITILHLPDIDTTIVIHDSLSIEAKDFLFLSESEKIDKIINVCVENNAEMAIGYAMGDTVSFRTYANSLSGEYREYICLDQQGYRTIDCKDMQELKTVIENTLMCAQIDKTSVMTISDEELKTPELSRDNKAESGVAVEPEIEIDDREQ